VRVVCRDRAGAYALAARDGAPDAIQCADRWHLWHNLAEHVERAVARHHGCLKRATSIAGTPSAVSPVTTTAQPPPAAERADQPTAGQESVLVERIRQRHATIQTLQAGGHGLREIGRRLSLDRKTVRRFAQAASADDLVAKAVDRPTLLDVHKSYLCLRWN
jgi:DNA-binding NarL/FixJ family response regulator